MSLLLFYITFNIAIYIDRILHRIYFLPRKIEERLSNFNSNNFNFFEKTLNVLTHISIGNRHMFDPIESFLEKRQI